MSVAEHVLFTPDEATPRRWWVRPRLWWRTRRRPTHGQYRRMLEEMLALNRELQAARLSSHEAEVALIRVRDWNTALLREKVALGKENAGLRQSLLALNERLEAAASAVVRSEQEADTVRKMLVQVQGERDDLENETRRAMTRIDALATKLRERRKKR